MAHKRRTAPGGTRGSVFKEVARIRREDAAVLFEARRYRGAIYLAGYAVECLLKWAITDRCEITYLPAELETHDWDTLLPEAGLASSLRTNRPLRAVYSELAELWGPELRYLSKEPAPREAERLYQQMEQVYRWVNEETL